MGRARRVIPGAIYLVTRRTWQRVFRLLPSTETNQILEYCLAYAASKTGVRILAYAGMSSHHHPDLEDVEGRYPKFLHLLHMLIAKGLNASQGQWGSLWADEKTSMVRLLTEEEIIDRIAYTAANPVRAGLVRRPEDWPGVMHFQRATICVKRPDVFFGSDMPETVELHITQPSFADDDPDGWFARVKEAVGIKVREAREHVEQAGKSFLGRVRVLKTSYLEKATSNEPRRGIKPTFAAKDLALRIAFIEVEKAFQIAYRLALRAWKLGHRNVAFPPGTWWMRVHHAARIEPPE